MNEVSLCLNHRAIFEILIKCSNTRRTN